MKIRKGRPPLDFGASNDAGPTPAEAEAVTPFRERDPGGEASAPLDPPPFHAVAAQPARPPAKGAEPAAERDARTVDADYEPPPAWRIYLQALAISVLWAMAPIAFAIGYRKQVPPLQNDVFALAVFALLAIGPGVFVFAAAYVIRQGQKLAAETRRAKAIADDMLSPALAAAARSGHVVQAVREEIVRAAAAADEARDTLLALRQAVAVEAERLAETTQNSVRTAAELSHVLGRERSEMGQLAQTLDAQAARVTDAVTQQARMVAEASELADTQLREAEASLSARAADLAAAAGEAGDAARTAGEDLVRHIARLETAGVGVSEQIRAVEGGLSEQRAALITLAHALRADHESFSQDAEAHASRLSEFITQARLSAVEMRERAAEGGEALKSLMADAAEQFRDIAETARAEREEFGQSTLHALEAVSQAAADQREQLQLQTRGAIQALHDAAEETREAAARHAAEARAQVDQLSEAAFAAGQKANQVFEARLEEAKALVQQSAQMVEEAGAATARKLDQGATAARATLQELDGMLGELEQRAAQMPAAARAQAEQVRGAVAAGMEQLMANARRTAAEAQAIDAAFQERVRRNFEMLSEAVRLMGTVAAAAPSSPLAPASAAAVPPPEPTPLAPRASFTAAYRPAPRLTPLETPPAAEASSAQPVDLDLDDLAPAPERAKPAVTAEAEAAPAKSGGLAERLGLRPRLKLTPTATDEEFSSIFEAAGGKGAAAASDEEESAEDEEPGEVWTWKDLLASIDGGEGEPDGDDTALAAELGKMGVDAAKLLPRPRIDEIAAAVQTGDLDGARAVVKRLAPAAIRRIVRRLHTDAALREQATGFVRRYQTLVDDAVVRDPEGFLMATMLSGESGRIYLLLDAAAGDVL